MSTQMIFKRYELKYLLTAQQKENILQAMEPYMALDQYGRTTIRNLYLDTDHFRLVRRSLEHPVYKEKLRIRSYCQVQPGQPVFVELKKKYHSVVYKRRILLPEDQGMDCLKEHCPLPQDSQIAREIDYVRTFYQTLHPVVFLSYEREAYYPIGGGDFRVTFDENILCRTTDLSLSLPPYGESLLKPHTVLMELKCAGGMPLWMARCLMENRIYKTSFSKYGTAYRTIIFPMERGKLHA